MLGFPRTHVKNMAGQPYTVTSALDWTETGDHWSLLASRHLKMASSRFNEETYGGKEERRKTGHLMASSSVLTSTHSCTLPSCILYLCTHTHTHPKQNKKKPKTLLTCRDYPAFPVLRWCKTNGRSQPSWSPSHSHHDPICGLSPAREDLPQTHTLRVPYATLEKALFSSPSEGSSRNCPRTTS